MKQHQNWYVRREGKVNGPFPAGLVSRYVLLGRIRLQDEVSFDREEWSRIEQLPALIPEVMREAMAQPEDEEVQQRLEAARRWADERREPTQPPGREERREHGAGESAHYRRAPAVDEIGERPDWSRRAQYGVVALIVLVVLAVGMLLPSGRDNHAPQCDAAPAPDVNWSNCRLEGSQLANKDLRHARLRNTDLNNAQLRATDLEGADLAYADLGQSNLRGANLHGASLRGSNLRKADLASSDLSGADLSYADLTDAQLGGANLQGAKLDNAIWGDGLVCMPGSTGQCRLARPAAQ